jgi:hypothetical protein
MRAPRRYRAALLAYPGRYRRARGRELLATLADGDDDRGGPSMREAAALAYRGVLKRAQIAGSGDGLLVIAAGIVVLALTGGVTWVERTFAFNGDPRAVILSGGGPGKWWGVALGVCAFLVIATISFGAADTSRRRKRATLLAAPLALALFTTPGRILSVGVTDPAVLPEFAWVTLSAAYANWTVTVPMCAACMAAAWIGLEYLSRLAPRTRPHALGAALVLLTGAVVAVTLRRPDLPAEYSRSAFADLQPGAFVAGLGLLMGVAALVRMRLATSGQPGANPD